ncbi:MAG: ATP-binding protein [Desulfobulbaceae bacterium]
MTDSPIYEKLDLFYLGREIEPESGQTTARPLLTKHSHLTTHAAIIGMTGSGKTGLGICLLEEAAIDRLPAIVIDPKGDMGNLLLTFPDMRPEDFQPWVDPARAEQKGISPEELARETATTWENGLRSWDQDKARIARLRANAEFSLFTPGSGAGRPVSVLASLEAPDPQLLADNATAASLVNSTVSSILGLVGIQGDPLTSREHILLAAIILQQWRQQAAVTLESLIGGVVSPPFAQIGVLPLESFFPQNKRMELAMQLNNILASPGFAAWTEGEPLHIESLLYTPEGRPRISIFSIAHLSESERMFFVTMLLGRLISWMRRQPGSSGLRCLLYMDEIFGYFPPLGNPPAKEPMLLLLKQARAYGLGVVLATQNPVDLDYKGLANIGTWFIGRLQTRQDQDRVMTGLAGGGALAEEEIRRLLAGLRGRTFLMHSAHLDRPILFEVRWVMSYLKGPIALSETARLVGPSTVVPAQTAAAGTFGVMGQAPGGGECGASPPLLPAAITQRFIPLPLPMDGVCYRPWLAGSATVRLFNQARGIDELRQVRRKIPLDGSGETADWSGAADNALPLESLESVPPAGAKFRSLPAWVMPLKNLRAQEKRFADHLYQSATLPLLRVAALKLESAPEETESQFRQRVTDHLRTRKEAETEKIRRQYEGREQTLIRRLQSAQARMEREKSQVAARGVDTALSFGVAVLGAFFGRKALSVTTATRSAQGVRSAGRLMKEKGDARRAEEEVARVQEEIAALTAELEERVVEVAGRFDPALYPLESFSLTPRRSDIAEVQLWLQWEPELNLPGMS